MLIYFACIFDDDTPSVLIGLSFSAAVGITLLVLGCALPQFSNWWPLFIIVFYILCPIPTFIGKRYVDNVESNTALIEVCVFLTSCIVVSAFGLPIVLAHAPVTGPVIQWGACGLVLTGNVVVFSTILAYFTLFAESDYDYGGGGGW